MTFSMMTFSLMTLSTITLCIMTLTFKNAKLMKWQADKTSSLEYDPTQTLKLISTTKSENMLDKKKTNFGPKTSLTFCFVFEHFMIYYSALFLALWSYWLSDNHVIFLNSTNLLIMPPMNNQNATEANCSNASNVKGLNATKANDSIDSTANKQNATKANGPNATDTKQLECHWCKLSKCHS